jgi:hypothetical protein
VLFKNKVLALREKTQKTIAKGVPKVAQNHHQIEPWAREGANFEIV